MRYHFSVRTTLALLPLATAFAGLGVWQWNRMLEKQTLMLQFEEAPVRSYAAAGSGSTPFARVVVSGNYSADWHLLHDNRIENGRTGVHVLSVFQPESGPALLVNRGWLPLPLDRRSLPHAPTPAYRVSISGLLAPLPGGGIRLGEPDDLAPLAGPRLVTYLDLDRLSEVMGDDLNPRVLLLDAHDPTGFGDRAWQPAVMLPGQHRAYAVQWFALAIAVLIVWLTLSLNRKPVPAPQDRDPRHRGGA